MSFIEVNPYGLIETELISCMKIEKTHDLPEVAKTNIERGIETIIVRVVAISGSTPRGLNAIMLVDTDSTHDTIGGGQLEWIATQKARSVMGSNFKPFIISIPLGPEINQCCGGKMDLEFSKLTNASLNETLDLLTKEDSAKPNIYIFGAGHTGTELAMGFARLPVNLICVDTRKEALKTVEDYCETIYTPIPEEIIRSAPSKSSFIILTHDHNLDFMLTAEALTRKDAAYIGMIGSATKKAVLKSWMEKNGFGSALLSKLTCPIGKSKIKDKRPQIIAALTISEVLQRAMR